MSATLSGPGAPLAGGRLIAPLHVFASLLCLAVVACGARSGIDRSRGGGATGNDPSWFAEGGFQEPAGPEMAPIPPPRSAREPVPRGLDSNPLDSGISDAGVRDANPDDARPSDVGAPDTGVCIPRCTPTRIVLFGGRDARGENLGDTWERIGGAWNHEKVSGPTPRSGAGMSPLGGRVVLFGGLDDDGVISGGRDDTWEWDGTSWTERKVAGPPPRWSPAMATLGDRVVLFGGFSFDRYLGDTWEWDGTSWTERKVAGPSPRTFHSMATLGSKVVLFGGQGESGKLEDTWEWDGSTWTERHVATRPRARSGVGLARLADAVVLFGGVGSGSGQALADTWEWDGDTWMETGGSGPAPRTQGALAAVDARLVLFGGNTASGYFSDTWEWDGDTWMESGGSGPSARSDVAVASW